MKTLFTKIINSVLAIVCSLIIIAVTYFVTQYDSSKLSASILTGIQSERVCAVEFVTPKGSAYPVNGVVKIQSVSVTVDSGDPTDYCNGDADDVITTEVVSGNDLASSFITFSDGSIACPAGTAFASNEIFLPSTFSSACSVDINTPTSAGINLNELTIEPYACSLLQTSVVRGYGSGFEEFDLSVVTLPVASTTKIADPFDFAALTPITSIDLDYPVTSTTGAKTFQIHLEFVEDIMTDPLNGIADRAKIVSNSGDGVYEIKVRNEDADVDTGLNFAYVFNDLMGADSPFIASMDYSVNTLIQLESRERGLHTNTSLIDGYQCFVNGAVVANCFAGGTDGDDGLGNPLAVLTTPLTLDNEVLQGDSALVLASSSAGELQWISSHPSILEVTTLSEAAQQEAGTPDFQDTTIGVVGVADPGVGSYNITDCKKDYDNATPPAPIPGTQTCTVTAKIPVEFNISGLPYTVNVAMEDEIVPVTVQGEKLTGFLEGSGTYTQSAGISIALTGTVTGIVSGSVSGIYSGTVTGQVTATINSPGSMAGVANEVTIADFTTGPPGFAATPVTPGTLTDIPGSFTSTVKKQADDVSHVAILYAKRPGTSILSALDKQGCIASFELDVIEKKVVLQMVDRQLGDVLDVSDTVQINAFVGGANSEINEYENITAASGIEWFSSNEEVATIDETGLLTALKPGVTNITARYDTGDTEIGTIESVPMKVTVNKINQLRVTLDRTTEDKLSSVVSDNAHKSVILAIHNSQAAGQTLVIEGQTVNITLPAGTYSNEISKVDAIVNTPITGLAAQIAALTNALPLPAATVPAPVITVTTVDGYPGMLILQPAAAQSGADNNGNTVQDINENSIVDIDTTALETDVAILPTYSNAIPLPASETYGLRVIAQYDNGATRLMPPTDFSWVNTPVNYLQQASLDSGLIKLGEISGTSTVMAKYLNANGSLVQSNYLTITVDSGPVIEFVRRIGSGSVTKGSRINLQTKISDVDTVDDITAISTSLVYSTYSTYAQINQDSSAIWFAATPFLEEISVVDQGATGTTTEEEGTTPAPQPVALQYKTYNIPLEIPVDQNLFDGVYKLILSISDSSNHTLNYVYPIRIGEIGEGDVDGNGTTNMVDVILAFQIAAGVNLSPTPAELQAANVDGVGGVTLIDVILLFNKVTKKP